jgi:glycine/D-amino acid oxidase-like deaminating enzyme
MRPTMRPIEECCYWFGTVPGLGSNPPLAQAVDADIAVVGAGFTGLWTALWLKTLEPQKSVVVVEQGITGYGASGRNAGIVSPCLDHSHALAIKHFGKTEAMRMARMGFDNAEALAEFADGCDFEKTGHLHVALTADQLDAYRDTANVAQSLGIDGHVVLSAADTRAQLNSPLYLGGLCTTGGGIVNPIKLIAKLAKEVESLGVNIFERTKVTGIANGAITAAGDGRIKAERIVLATDAYTHHLFPHLLMRYIPLYDYILVSEPLSDDQLQAIGWHNRQGITDGRTFFNYYRLTADNRILWGTSEAAYYPPNRVDLDCDHSQPHYDGLRASFKRHFPQLASLDFPFAWGGPIASTTRLTPFFGTLQGGKVLYGLGYTGHGIASTRLAGKILAHMAIAKPSELLQLKMVCHQPMPYPPEPLRSLAVNAVTRSLQRVDAGEKPALFLRMLDALGIGFSS